MASNSAGVEITKYNKKLTIYEVVNQKIKKEENVAFADNRQQMLHLYK